MNKTLTALFLTAALLTACGTPATEAERAGTAMAETACLLFKNNGDMSAVTDQMQALTKKYGFETPTDVETYLKSIQGTPDLDTVTATIIKTLKADCGSELDAQKVDPTEFANAMVQQ